MTVTINGTTGINTPYTTASANTAVGYQTLYSQTGSYGANSCFGYKAGYSATTGGGNTLIGYQAGYSLTTGNGNTFIGPNYNVIGAGYLMTNGSLNTIIGGFSGNQGGLDIRTANNYIVLSDGDGNPRQIIDSNGKWGVNGSKPQSGWITTIDAIAFGGSTTANCFVSGNSNTNQIEIRNNAYYATGTNETYAIAAKAAVITLNNSGQIATATAGTGVAGNSITFTAGPYVANLGTSWTNSSDERLKDVTGEIQNAVSKVQKLRAAEFTWKVGENKSPQVGLIAQDLLEVLPEVVVVPEEEFDGTPRTALGVNYDSVIPLLVAAIKELKAEIDALKGAK